MFVISIYKITVILIIYLLHVYEPEYITGPSGVIPIAVLKEESNVEILLHHI